MRHIVKVDVYRMTETCNRTTYFVRLTTDEGFTLDPEAHRSHCDYDDMNGTTGLSIEKARDYALMTAASWADFLDIPVTPYYEDGVLYEPSMLFESYTMQREERAEDEARAAESAAS